MTSWTLALPALAYLAGSLNFSILACRLLDLPDPRLVHSRNPGVSNVYRQAGLGWASLVLVLDIARAGILGVLSLRLIPSDAYSYVALTLVLGNRYPLFHGFRGGKGVANYLGFCSVVHPLGGALACVAWLIVAKIAPFAFVGSLAMALTLSVFLMGDSSSSVMASIAVLGTLVLIVAGHRDNIAHATCHRKSREINQP